MRVLVALAVIASGWAQLAAAQTSAQPVPAPATAATTTTKAAAAAATSDQQAPAAAASPSASKATEKPPASGATTGASKASPAKPAKKVDLNNASLAELKTLPTVTDEYAKKIIANRPYKSKGELVTKAGLPEGVYQAVKRKVELQTPRKPAPKK